MMIRPENEQTENKTTLKEWRGGVISLAAFATARGKTVRFGIDPHGRRVGVTLGQNTLENLANDIKLNTEPPLFPSISVEGDESAAVVKVRRSARTSQLYGTRYPTGTAAPSGFTGPRWPAFAASTELSDG